MTKKNFVIMGSLASMAIIGIFAILFTVNVNPEIKPQDLDVDKEIFSPTKNLDIFESSQEIKKIKNEAELREFFAKIELNQESFDDRIFVRDQGLVRELRETFDGALMTPTAEPSHGGVEIQNAGSVSLDRTSASDHGLPYSTTNVQVKNVDEPDFLKNDGKYIYILYEDKLTIIQAYPANEAKIILKIGLDINRYDLRNMFLNKDRLVIFYNDETNLLSIPEFEYEPHHRSTPTTHALILDISQRENPKILKDFEVDGYYHNSRMIGDFVYFISQQGINYHDPIIPLVRESSETILRPDIYYFDNPQRDYNFNTITSFNIFDETINSETYLMGNADTIYVSEDNFYITYQKHYPYNYYDTIKRDRFFDVIVPLLPPSVQSEIKSIENSTLDWYEKWQRVSDLLEVTYNQMSDTQRSQLFEKIQKALEDYDSKFFKNSQKTIIHKISIDGENLKYSGKGEVPGYLLNQFSMDEKNGAFRIATTSSFSGMHQSFTHNNVYVLDEDLKIQGSLEGIAKDETIYSARFMGDKLYLVTFQRIDPFFVIDLSQNTPKVLGELKIPGFSNYLHPYDENHIIGIGRDTEETKGGGVQTLGLKIALFDVTQFSNPKVVDEVIIGNRSTETEVLHNHKALLFDKEKNILVLPILDYENLKWTEQNGEIRRHSQNWFGFFVYGIDPKNGFDLKGTIEHYSGQGHQYGFNDSNRSFYIGDVVYTVSNELVKMNDIKDIKNEVNQIKFRDGAQIVKYLDQ